MRTCVIHVLSQIVHGNALIFFTKILHTYLFLICGTSMMFRSNGLKGHDQELSKTFLVFVFPF